MSKKQKRFNNAEFNEKIKAVPVFVDNTTIVSEITRSGEIIKCTLCEGYLDLAGFLPKEIEILKKAFKINHKKCVK